MSPPRPEIDSATRVRDGEQLDVARLERYLRDHVEGAAGESLVVEQFPGGHSNLTYLLRLGERELVLRRPPFGPEIKSAHDMGREHRVLSAICDVYPKAPRPVAHCEDREVIGAPFYVMNRVEGVILRRDNTGDHDLPPGRMATLSRALVDDLAAIHAVDLEATGLADFGRPEGYVRRQVEGWTGRWVKAKTDDVPDVERAATWLAEHLPAGSAASLIHNDYKYDNVVLDPSTLESIVAVLDWEMATVGDPLLDLGTTLSLWADPDDPDEVQAMSFGPTMLPGNLDRDGVVQRYAETSGRDVGDPLFPFVYGLFKMAVVLQQISKRYVTGHSTDERFALMPLMVQALGLMSSRALDRGRIHGLG